MNKDNQVRVPLLLCTFVIVLAAAYFASPIIAPVTMALFIVAIVWPLQSALQKGIPKLLALVVTLLITLAVIALLGFLMTWAFGLIVQWLVNNAERFQTLYVQAEVGSTDTVCP